jgi:hypothetical protein
MFRNKNHTAQMTSAAQQISRITLTFGEFCDALYFVTKNGNEEPKGLFLGHHYERLSGRDLWNQIAVGWLTVALKHVEEFEYFIKLDSDSFLFPGNLRFMAKQNKWDPESYRYFGHTLFEQSRSVSDPIAQFNIGAGCTFFSFHFHIINSQPAEAV